MRPRPYHPCPLTCPTDAELLAFADGSLSPAGRSSTETHLDSCPSCPVIVAALARDSASVRPDAESTAASPLATPGPLLADGAPRYVPGVEIARGGMGRILAVEDRLLGRRVALEAQRDMVHGGGTSASPAGVPGAPRAAAGDHERFTMACSDSAARERANDAHPLVPGVLSSARRARHIH